MLLLIVVLGVLVAADRFGVFGGGGVDGGGGELTPQERYTSARALAASVLARAGARDRIGERLEEARARWSEVEPRVVSAPTLAIAQGQFRDAVLRALEASGVGEVSGSFAGSGRRGGLVEGGSGGALEPMVFEVGFEVRETAVALRAIDRLERMRRPEVRVTGVSFDGPGVRTSGRELRVELTLTGVALLDRAGEESGG